MSTLQKLPLHVSREAMRATLDEHVHELPSFPSDSAEAFLERAVKWVRMWRDFHAAEGLGDVGPFALVRGDVQTTSAALDWEGATLFDADPDRDLTGLIALAASSSLVEVRTLRVHAHRLKDLGTALEAAGLGDCPTLFVDPPRQRIIPCPGGCRTTRSPALRLDGSPDSEATLDAVSAALDEFHTQWTRYPDGLAHVWSDRKARVLYRDAEAIVRDHLFAYFKLGPFSSQLVRREEQTSVGRPDLSILDKIGGQPQTICVMELKVLRSRGLHKNPNRRSKAYDDKSMLRHARMGLKQALKYKQAEHAAFAFCCLYDGRDTNSDLPEVDALAKANLIQCRRFFMERSTRDDLDELNEEAHEDAS